MTGTTARTSTDLRWRLELAAQAPDRVADRARQVAGRHAAALAAVCATVWLFDLAQVIAQ